MLSRGAFIVFEGGDRAGKSTQVQLLADALRKKEISVETRAYPDRSTSIGSVINNYLKNHVEIAPEVVLMLFSANRWETQRDITKSLHSGVTVVSDRYAASGAAYAAANSGRDLEWCKQPDKGLPAPDLVVYLEAPSAVLKNRATYGDERFEKEEMQSKVQMNFECLFDNSWVKINADSSKEDVHSEVLKEALKTIKSCKEQPIKLLYEL